MSRTPSAGTCQRPVPVHPHHEPATGPGVDVRVAAGVDPGEDDGDGGTLGLSAQLLGNPRQRVVGRVVAGRRWVR